MNFYKNDKRVICISDDGGFIEVGQLHQVRTVSCGVNRLKTLEAKVNDTPISQQQFFNTLFDVLDRLNISVDKIK